MQVDEAARCVVAEGIDDKAGIAASHHLYNRAAQQNGETDRHLRRIGRPQFVVTRSIGDGAIALLCKQARPPRRHLGLIHHLNDVLGYRQPLSGLRPAALLAAIINMANCTAKATRPGNRRPA